MNTIDYYYRYNIKYLLDLNKEKNNQKISNFISETGIKRTAIRSWIKKGSIPIESNLKLIASYFNKWLGANLTPDTLLYDDIQRKDYSIFVKEQTAEYGPDLDKKLIEQIQRLSTKGKKTILDLLKDFE